MKRVLIVILILLPCLFLSAQTEGVSINDTGADPDPSAILDAQSTSKGILIPRMNSIQRNAISNPANGLLVFDTDSNDFWFFNGSIWGKLSGELPDRIIDTDGDTKILVEKNSDEDRIRFEVKGNEVARIDSSGNFGIGSTSPKEKLEINGALLIGNTDSLNEGTIRYSGSDFEGYNGGEWSSFTKSALTQTGHLGVNISDSVLGASNFGNQSFGISVTDIWQSFTAVNSGSLYKLEVKLYNEIPVNATFQIFEGEGKNGALLLSGSIPGSLDWVTLFDNESIPVIKGEKYTIRIQKLLNPGLATTMWSRNYNKYTDGMAGGAFAAGPGQDLFFKTYVNNEDVVFSFDSTNSTFTYANNTIFIDENRNVGIGTTAPDTSLHLDGKLKYEDGTQTEGAVLTSDSDGIASWNNTLILKNGNLGLGTNSPDTKLHLNGQLKYQYGIQTEGAVLTSDSDGSASWNNTLILKNGNLGLGTNSPDTKLHLNGQLKYQDGTQTEGAVLTSDSDGIASWNNTLILKNGNLGLGTNSPDTSLHLAGKFKYDDGTQTEGAVLTSDSDGIASWDNTLIIKNGNLGLGTNSPDTKLHLDGLLKYYDGNQAEGAVLTSDSDGIASWNDALILKNGNLGLGTNAPDTKLHLNGQLKYEDGNQTEGAVLTSDPNGVSNWNDNLILKGGKIGIGTNTPHRPLTIEDNTWDNSVNGGGNLKIINSGVVGAGITLQSTATGGKNYSLLSTGPSGAAGTGTFGIWDHGAIAYRLVIKPSGNVGIGIYSPAAKLHVQGAALFFRQRGHRNHYPN